MPGENLSNYLEEVLINHVLRNVAYTSPTDVYVGLVSDVASDAHMEAGTLTNEITAYDGNRKAVTFDAPVQDGDGRASVKNATAAIEFEDMPAVTVKYAIVCDSATKGSGNILYWCPLVDSVGARETRTANAGDTFRLPQNLLLCKMG